MSNFMRWLKGEPLPGDKDYFLYERVKRGITNEQQLRETYNDASRGDDVFKKANARSKKVERDD